MPKWTFENKITMGNLMQIALLVAGFVYGYATLSGSAASSSEAVKAIPGIESRVTTIETRINLGLQAREQFQQETKQALREQSAILSQLLQSNATILAKLERQ